MVTAGSSTEYDPNHLQIGTWTLRNGQTSTNAWKDRLHRDLDRIVFDRSADEGSAGSGLAEGHCRLVGHPETPIRSLHFKRYAGRGGKGRPQGSGATARDIVGDAHTFNHGGRGGIVQSAS